MCARAACAAYIHTLFFLFFFFLFVFFFVFFLAIFAMAGMAFAIPQFVEKAPSCHFEEAKPTKNLS